MVSTLWFAAADTGTGHERTGSPFRCTVQAPHCAIPQPNFGPFTSSTSRNTHNSGISGSTSTLCFLPLTVSSIMESPLAWLTCGFLKVAGTAAPSLPDHARRSPWFLSGSDRIRLPVAAKIALTSAGASGASGVSPSPPQKPPLGTSTASILFGISARSEEHTSELQSPCNLVCRLLLEKKN